MANATVTTEVVGVKDALRELNKIDKRARRFITKRFREIMLPTLQEARSLLPQRAPMSGWERFWNAQPGLQRGLTRSTVLPWVPENPRRIEAFVSGSRPKEIAGVTRGLAAFGIRWKGSQAALFDMSQNPKTPQGNHMVDVLNQRFGTPSRVMWRAFERTDDDVEAEIEKLVKDVMRATQPAIARRY
jgi:hypothetical protein